MVGERPYGLVEHGALAITNATIDWVGPYSEMPKEFLGRATHDLGGHVVTPGLIDCHTHLVYAGNRAREFEMRLNGATYAELAKAGGGIVSTVNATRKASELQLLKGALQRVDQLLSEGVNTIEIKSGYGLDVATELKMLRVARRIEQERSVRIKTTFLGAHALPPEYANRADEYIDFVCERVLPVVHKENLADAVDVFCEGIGFSLAQTKKVFEKATELGLPIKLHAEQLSNLQGAATAASYGALSADHLEYLDQAGVNAMREAGTVAVLLPGAFYILRETRLPPIKALREAGVPMAIATDCNPGSSPVNSLLLILNMACTLFRLTPEEALAGVTREAARALGAQNLLGTLEAGKRADFAVWDIEHPAELSYNVGFNTLQQRYFRGVAV